MSMGFILLVHNWVFKPKREPDLQMESKIVVEINTDNSERLHTCKEEFEEKLLGAYRNETIKEYTDVVKQLSRKQVL